MKPPSAHSAWRFVPAMELKGWLFTTVENAMTRAHFLMSVPMIPIVEMEAFTLLKRPKLPICGKTSRMASFVVLKSSLTKWENPLGANVYDRADLF